MVFFKYNFHFYEIFIDNNEIQRYTFQQDEITHLIIVEGRSKIMSTEFKKTKIHGGSAFEDVAGYARIIKAGPFAYVSGTTAVTPEGTVYGEGDAYAQAKYIFDKLVSLMEENGIKREEVIKVNIYTTDVTKNMDITKAYSEYFKETRPACTWLGVAALNRPSQLVEIEMQAIIGAED